MDTILVQFNTGAATIYANLLSQFQTSIHNISRHRDENVFKLQAAKYGYALKLQLTELARKTSEASQSHMQDKVQTALSARVNFYLQQFKLKWNAL